MVFIIEENIFSHIRTTFHSLSPTQKKIANYILQNPQKVVLHSISALAAECNTSETTIFRFLRKIGYESYQVFRVHVAQDIATNTPQSIYGEIEASDSVADIKHKVIELTTNSIQDMKHILEDQAVTQFIEQMKQAHKTVFFGAGASSFIAGDAYHKFLQLGFEVSLCGDPHMMNMIATHATEHDFIVAISHSGESREILDAVQFAKEKGATVASITSYPKSELAKKSDFHLLSSSRETTYRSDSMISRINQLVIIDVLYVAAVLELGSNAIDNVKRSRLAVAKNKT